MKQNSSSEQLDLKKVKRGISIVIALGLLAAIVIIATTFNKDTLVAFSKIDSLFLLYALGALVVSWIFSGLPFYVLARIVGKPVSMSLSMTIYLAGSFFGFITPFGSGLLPTQIFIMNKNGLTVGQATAVASTRATISAWLFVSLGLAIYFAFGKSLPQSATAVLAGVVMFAATWSLVIIGFAKKPDAARRFVGKLTSRRIVLNRFGETRINNFRDKLYEEIDYLSSNLKDVFSAANAPAVFLVFLIEVIAWLALFSVLPLVLYGFGVKDNFAQLIFRLFILFCLAPVSPTPGGSGVVEVGFTTLLSDLVPHHIIGLVILLWRAITYYLTLIVGGLFLLRFVVSTPKTNSKNR
ncbi:MAG: flippase-like domain-containing protein [Rubrobacteridae bacterium]|nr:flippase-like domain-containing protein [Rubrobacteridae bacterium]